MKKTCFSVLVIILSLLLVGCCITHEWVPATCATPKTCTKCNAVEGETLPHIWEDATCMVPKTCTECGISEGNLSEHIWIDATCDVAQTCSICGEKVGDALGHNWSDAEGHTSKVCTLCAAIQYADTDFLDAIEESIYKRSELVDKDKKLKELVQAELAIINKYYALEYSDENLQKLAVKYIDGLVVQQDALDLLYSENQIKWYEGAVMRFEALCALQEQYGVFEDTTFFDANYALELENAKEYLNALKTIEADLVLQLDNVELEYESKNTYYAIYTNNTSYDFDIDFYMWFYDKNGTRISENSLGFTNILSEKKTKFTFWCPSKATSFEYEWVIYPYVS